jgi:hypothetical protein
MGDIRGAHFMKKKTVLIVFLVSAVVAALAFMVLGKKEGHLTGRSYTWYVDYTETSDDAVLVRGSRIHEIKNDVDKLVAALNASDADPESLPTPAEGEGAGPPKIKLMKVEHGVAFVAIINAECVTQRMGSSGARDYLASVTYTLTENRQIRKVDFLFEEGDHAAPGIYVRESFANYKIAAESNQ